MDKSSSFYNLNPEKVLLAAEKAGFIPTGEFTQLNSYENRVFDIKLEEPYAPDLSNISGTSNTPEALNKNKNLIAKFYRPYRWSKEAILDEHEFLISLKNEGIFAVAPLQSEDDKTLFEIEGMYVAFFPKILGRMPQEFLSGELHKVGRLMAQVHNVGARKPALHRPNLDTLNQGWSTLDFLQEWISPELRKRYNIAAEDILYAIDDTVDSSEFIRIHGDCHKGNLLNNGKEFFLVDFDDFLNGPVMQDFWMLLSGDEDSLDDEKMQIIDGYEELREFPHHQWSWIPLLRGLRIIHYAGWIGKRWEDPSFPRLFPEYNTYKYWAEEVEALEKIAWQIQI
ncbi:MAG: serine/threonine protein kinase [Bdellovibrio sp.]